ncbi:hypothetical protein HDU98_005601 [Podochytrium sp. JEL0797]|nr:hypothetical protein HDU98_005601 [Podochytrium sp. JEL0797]
MYGYPQHQHPGVAYPVHHQHAYGVVPPAQYSGTNGENGFDYYYSEDEDLNDPTMPPAPSQSYPAPPPPFQPSPHVIPSPSPAISGSTFATSNEPLEADSEDDRMSVTSEESVEFVLSTKSSLLPLFLTEGNRRRRLRSGGAEVRSLSASPMNRGAGGGESGKRNRSVSTTQTGAKQQPDAIFKWIPPPRGTGAVVAGKGVAAGAAVTTGVASRNVGSQRRHSQSTRNVRHVRGSTAFRRRSLSISDAPGMGSKNGPVAPIGGSIVDAMQRMRVCDEPRVSVATAFCSQVPTHQRFEFTKRYYMDLEIPSRYSGVREGRKTAEIRRGRMGVRGVVQQAPLLIRTASEPYLVSRGQQSVGVVLQPQGGFESERTLAGEEDVVLASPSSVGGNTTFTTESVVSSPGGVVEGIVLVGLEGMRLDDGSVESVGGEDWGAAGLSGGGKILFESVEVERGAHGSANLETLDLACSVAMTLNRRGGAQSPTLAQNPGPTSPPKPTAPPAQENDPGIVLKNLTPATAVPLLSTATDPPPSLAPTATRTGSGSAVPTRNMPRTSSPSPAVATPTTNVVLSNQQDSIGVSSTTIVFIVLGCLVAFLALLVLVIRAAQVYHRKSRQSPAHRVSGLLDGRGGGGSSVRRFTGEEDTRSWSSRGSEGHKSPVQESSDRPYDTMSVERGVISAGFSPPPASIPSHLRVSANGGARSSVGTLDSFYRTLSPVQRPEMAAVVGGRSGDSFGQFGVYVPKPETVAHAFLMLGAEEESAGGMTQRGVAQVPKIAMLSPAQMSWRNSAPVAETDAGGSGISSDAGYTSPVSASSSEGMVVRSEVMALYGVEQWGEGV